MVTYDELVEELAETIFAEHYGEDSKQFLYNHKHFKSVATATIATILGVLQEPTEGMLTECDHAGWSEDRSVGVLVWDAMLNASPLVPR